jgi:hypothetical protein
MDRLKQASLLHNKTLADVADGSFASILAYPRGVRFAPHSDRIADIPIGSFVPTETHAPQQRAALFDYVRTRDER